MSMQAFNNWLNKTQAGLTGRCLAGLDKVLVPQTQVVGTEVFQVWDSLMPAAMYTENIPSGIDQDFWCEFLVKVLGGADDAGIIGNAMSAMWPVSGVLAHGPKVYAPAAAEFSALAKVKLNITGDLYRQPYDTTIVIVPDGLFKIAPRPIACVGRYLVKDGNTLINGLILSELCGHPYDDISWSAMFTGDQTVETRLKEINDDERCRHLDDETEAEATETIKRAFMNACMLLSNCPRHESYSNPLWADKLRASLAKKNLPDSVRRANAASLAGMPRVMTFDQRTTVYRTEGVSNGKRPDADSPPTIAPHWRCGHWANLACGTGRAERKLVYRQPVLVNPELLVGPAAGTKVVYS